MQIIGHIKKQQSQMAEVGLIGQITVDFLASKNKGAIEAMPGLQSGGAVVITIQSAQGTLFSEETK